MTQVYPVTATPWHIDKQWDPIVIGIRDAVGRPICELGNYGDDNRDANSQLLAAAPDLLAACEAALLYLDHPDVQAIPFILSASTSSKHLRATIAIAKGA